MIELLLQQFETWLRNVIENDVIPELVAFVFVLLVGLLLQAVLKRILARIRHRIIQPSVGTYAPWASLLIDMAEKAARPFSIWIVGLFAIRLLSNLGLPTGIMTWLMPFFGIWTIYGLLSTLLRGRLSPDQVHLWVDQILRPVVILLVAMQALGILDDTLGYQINFGKGIIVPIGALVVGLVVFYIFMLISRYVRLMLKDVILPRMDVDPSLTPIVVTISGYLIITVGVLLGLSVAGVSMTNVAVILGGLSVGVGFGLKELINNFISGFILLLERSLIPGDVVELENESGIVESIKLRTTQIRTFDNVELIVPNGLLLGGIVTNYSQRDGVQRKRVRINVGASYDADPQLVVDTLLAAAATQPDVLANPNPQVLMTEFGDSSISYELRAWVADNSKMSAASSALRMTIWHMFRDRAIDMPFPQRELHIRPAAESPMDPNEWARRNEL